MTAWLLACWLLGATGSTLVLAGAPWFRRAPLRRRLGPYARHAEPVTRTFDVRSIGHVIAPGAERVGRRLGEVLGVTDDLATRLERADLPVDAATFRVRQATRALLGGLASLALVLVVRPPALLALVVVISTPLLFVLAEEQRVSTAIARRRARIRAELPVVTEQMGLLLSAGYSLPGAVSRLAERSDGTIAADLARVTRRIRQGLGAAAALTEWADRSGVDELHRLVAVLRLHDDAGDLGSLIAQEARAIRAAAHRELLEVIERRSQLVWIPVTVATLVPGLIFLAVPFTAAMAQVAGSG